jgi:sn-glycerol 3-phosphate transport system permease protein
MRARPHLLARDWLTHAILIAGILIFAFPIYVAIVASTQDSGSIGRGDLSLLPGTHLVENYIAAWFAGGGRITVASVRTMLVNSLVMALVIAVGKIAISIISAYAVVFFSFPGRMVFFWMIFVTLMLPVEVRIIPTYEVASNLHLINSYAGLTIPLIASATATLLFRQFFLTIPDELIEAAKIDGAGPLRFFWDTVLPLSRTNLAALFVILFIYGWNQYLWPLLVTTSRDYETMVVGVSKMIGTGDAQNEWATIMATAVLTMLPPVGIVVLMQRWFVKGLVESEK